MAEPSHTIEAMDSVASDLAATLVAAYPEYISRRLEASGLPPVPEQVVANGAAWLEERLGVLLSERFEVQRRGPLELFQEAMRFPTEALVQGGVAEVARDETAAAALPGDVYGLAPASSAEISEKVWEAHLAWGAAKASYLRRPVIGLAGGDLLDRSKIEPVVTELGMRLVVWSAPEQIPDERGWALVDLSVPWAGEAMARLAAAGAVFYAYGSHVDELVMQRARELGARDAVPRSRFFRNVADFLPRLA
jgi:hypothetical protein